MNTKKTGGKRKRAYKKVGRKSRALTEKPLLLIVCEGKKTEPQYFDAFRKQLRLKTAQIEIVPGSISGTDPKNIVDYAEKRNEARKRKGKLEYDFIWCVFDCDEHKKIKEAFDKAKARKYKLAFSNPSFELWGLLHFQEQNKELDRKQARKDIKKFIPKYKKGMENLYDVLLPHQKTAIQRAKKLRRIHKHNLNPETDNPSTTADKLVEYLNSLSSDR